MMHRIQRRVARIVISNYEFVYVKGDDLLCGLKWTPFKERVRYCTCSLMFKSIHGGRTIKSPCHMKGKALFAGKIEKCALPIQRF